MDSIWTQNIEKPKFPPLPKDIKTDVLIIGGGLTGILCAHIFSAAGIDCVLCEADRLCDGITKNTTAKITLAHGLIYDKMIKRFGVDMAQDYFWWQSTAIDKYRELCRKIDCDFEEKSSYVYSLSDRRKLEREAEALLKIGAKAELVKTPELPFETAGAVKMDNQAQFHPLKFAYALLEGLPIYENTKVLELTPYGAITNRGKIRAKKIVVATHFPILNKHGSYFLKLYQHRSYVLALRGVAELNGMYVDDDDKGLSFRSYKDTLLLGGGSHRTGKKGGCWQELSDFAHLYYNKTEEICRFATQDCMTLDRIPYIGQYSARTRNLYVATGYNKWGMSSSMVAAMVLCDELRGKKHRSSEIFSPSRSIIRPQLAANAAESLIGLITPTAPRCPHLGCALKYNKEEHSWDCPCHGSRFSEDGELIDNPATDDKKR